MNNLRPNTGHQQIRCGYLIVPENRAKPDGRQLRLVVAILKSLSASPKPDPVLTLAGGPGAPSVVHTPENARRSAGNPIRADRDVIFFDPRGVGYSEPQFCPELAARFRGLSFGGLSAAERRARMSESLADCQKAMSSAGVDLSQYNSIAGAQDVEDLRRTLGYEQWNLLARSYGTRLALEILRTTPTRIRSVILDAPIPPNRTRLAATFHEAMARLLAACAADPGCGMKHPDVVDSFAAVIEALDRQPLVMQTDGQEDLPEKLIIDGHAFATVMYSALYDRRILPLVPLLIHERRGRNQQVALAMVRNISRRNPVGRVSRGLNLAVTCYEIAPFNRPHMRVPDGPGAPPVLQRIDWGVEWWPDTELCDAYHPFRAAPEQAEPVVGNVPVLIFAGEFDPIAHRSYGPLLARTLSRSRVVDIPGGGHSEAGQHQYTGLMLVEFIADPMREPDRSCLQSISRWQFVTDVNAAMKTLA